LTALTSGTASALQGTVRVPGDKSISHRALMIGAIAVGETVIEGLLESEDVHATAAALRAMGAAVRAEADGRWRVRGVGVGGLAEPESVLDLGNSGTSARLLMGLVATQDMTTHMTGDASLCRRPMARVATPLERMGASFLMRAGGRMPLVVQGTAEPVPIVYETPVPSAQVKSAIILAGLNTPGATTVIERAPTRDHTELMLRHFGAAVAVADDADGRRHITVGGWPELAARPVIVPTDPSSAAFPAVAALLVPGSVVTVTGVGMNPLRAGLYTTLAEMGADVTLADRRIEAGEPVADLVVRGGRLAAVDVPAARAPSMIDEYPILAVAAAFATGRSRFRGLAELRVKESDRLAAIETGLAAAGVAATVEGDDLVVEGRGGPPRGGCRIATNLDHRIAMAFLVLGLAAERPVEIDDGRVIDTSFPGFVAVMNGLGATIGPAG